MDKLLKDNDRAFIIILSGDRKGRLEKTECFLGRRTSRAIRLRLSKERRSGKKWAKALLYRRDLESGPFTVDLETGKPYPWPK